MGLPYRVVRFLTRTRLVPTQLYRLMVLGWGISGILQVAFGAPASVTGTTGSASWFDWMFIVVQLCAAVTILTGLYLVEGNTHHASKLNRSLALELIGIIELETVIGWQLAASIIYNGRIPTAGASWMMIIFGAWILVRVRDILRAQRELGRA